MSMSFECLKICQDFFPKILLAGDESNKEINPRVSQFLSCMKIMCQQKRPEVCNIFCKLFCLIIKVENKSWTDNGVREIKSKYGPLGRNKRIKVKNIEMNFLIDDGIYA